MRRNVMRCYVLIPILLLIGYFNTISLGSKPSGFMCWSSPTKDALKKCEKVRTCDGAGIYAWHPKMNGARYLSITTCKKKYGECVLNYCEVK